MHWAEVYVGEPYVPGLNDCAALAERVLNEVFDLRICLPKDRPRSLHGMSQAIEAEMENYGVITESPKDGDAVLMLGKGRLNHIGVYCFINGEPWVLHAMRDSGQVCLHRARDLPAYELTIEGFYKWIVLNE